MQTDRGNTVNPGGERAAQARDQCGGEKLRRQGRLNLGLSYFPGDRSRRPFDRLVVRQAAAVRSVQQLAYPYRRHRPAEQIALRLGHGAVGADQFQLLVGLDAFDHHRHSEVGTEPRHAAQQRQRTIAIDAFQEGTIDLHFLQWEVVQVTQARITGTEVVQRYSHADHVQLRQYVVGQLRVAQQRGFGDLDLEAVGGQPRDLERVTHLAQHVALMELLR